MKQIIIKQNGQIAGLSFFIIVLSTIIWTIWMVMNWMKHTHYLTLARLVITGERYYTSNNDVREAILTIGAPSTFITLDVKVIQNQIEHISWIQKAYVRKQWPDILKIHLIEYTPIAYWDDLYLIDHNGHIFKIPEDRIINQEIPKLYGPKGKEKNVLAGYYIMNQILTAAKFRLKSISMNARNSWKLILKNNIQLQLDRNNNIECLKQFIDVYPILLQQAWSKNKKISYVDLRYDSGMAVGWS
ncbi:cell division protein FtsQ/DivIB [Candidatus Curculioniphilus buchneri]|uniref:cell division protein FtsQ/DivIB n=1 Tax=Candidatus Curculioniphilus buchneri TaxID=690594 RepID=UPI00376F172A